MTKLTRLALFSLLVVAALSYMTATATMSNPNEPEGYHTYFDLAYDASRQRLYGSIENTGEVEIRSATTLALIQTLDLGTSALGLDMNAAADQLAVALEADGEIALINLDTLGSDGTLTMPGAYDVIYGRPGRLYAVGNASTDEELKVFDTSGLTVVGQSSLDVSLYSSLAITADKNTVYVGKSQGFRAIYRFDVTTDMPNLTGQTTTEPFLRTLAVSPDGSKVFTSRGEVWSGDLTTKIDQFSFSGDEIEYVPTQERLYVSDGLNLATIDANTYAVLSSEDIGELESVARADDQGNILYVSVYEENSIKKVPINPALWNYVPLVFNEWCGDFFDDFSNSASGWPIINTPDILTQYLLGEYRIRIDEAGAFIPIVAPTCAHNYYEVEADVRWVGTPGSRYGLLFGLSEDQSEYFLFAVSPTTQTFELWHFFPGGSGIRGPFNSATINPGNGSNHLKAIVHDDPLLGDISLEINGVNVGNYFEPDIPVESSSGLFSNSRVDNPISDARFDNFSVMATD